MVTKPGHLVGVLVATGAEGQELASDEYDAQQTGDERATLLRAAHSSFLLL